VPIVGTFVGRDQHKTVEENFGLFEQVWPPIVQFAGDHGVKIAIENCPMIFSNDEWPGGANLAATPAIWRRMWEIIPDPNFGLNLDPSHLVWQMIDYVRVVYDFGPRIFHVHAKDMRVDREQLHQHGVLSLGMGWQIPRLPGLGEVRWDQFISALYAVGYDYVVSIEHEDRAFEKTRELVERGFLIARDALRPYIH
jgi:sugar phosphate isomerase/epimerase